MPQFPNITLEFLKGTSYARYDVLSGALEYFSENTKIEFDLQKLYYTYTFNKKYLC